METGRAQKSVDFLAYSASSNAFPMLVVAALSTFALIIAIAYSIVSPRTSVATGEQPLLVRAAAGTGVSQSAGTALSAGAYVPAATTSLADAVIDALASQYVTLQSQGLYSPEVGQAIGQGIAYELAAEVPARTYMRSDIKTDPDTSPSRVQRYRTDLKRSLEPITKNTEPEFITLGRYVDTKDDSYLRAVRNAADNYRAAAEATAEVVAPADAVQVQLAVINALEQFAATLTVMSNNAHDPFAFVALFKNYNDAEGNLETAIKALNAYENGKKI